MMKKASRLTAVSIALLIVVSIFTPLAYAEQPEWLPTPREETLVTHDAQVYTIFDSFNPFIPNGGHYQSGWYNWNLEFLWYINYATGEWIYWLITGWEYQDNYKTFILHVRPGVTWNDGEPFTANDIVFTINMVKGNERLYWHDWADEWIEEATAPDKLTAVLKLKKPNPRIHYSFRGWALTIVPEHVWKNVDPTTFKNYPPVSTGPYKLKAVYPDLKMFVWERRDDYWAKDVMGMFPQPKYIVMRTAPPADQIFTEYVKGYTDFGRDLPMEMVKKAAEVNRNCTWVPFYDPCPRGLWINCQKYPLSLPEVRWAISYCIDREKLASVWPSLETPPTVPAKFPWADWAGLTKFVFSDVFEKYKLEFNPDKAAQILDSLNFKDRDGDGIRETPNGTRLSWTIITPVAPGGFEHTAALELSEVLKTIGVETTVKTLPWATFDEMLSTGQADMASYWLCTGMPWNSDAYYLIEGFHSKYAKRYPVGTRMLAGAWVRLVDPELDEVIDKLAVIDPSHPDYMDLAKKGIELFMRDLPAIPIVQTIYTMPWQTTYWTNWPMKGNFYAWPPNWWPEFLFVVLNLKSTRVTPTPTVSPGEIEAISKAITGLTSDVATISGQVTSLTNEVKSLKDSLGVMTAGIVIEAVVIIILAAVLLMALRKK